MNKNILFGAGLLLVVNGIAAEPVVYTNEALFLADLATLGFEVIHESAEDDVAWAETRSTIPNPGGASSATSKGIVWRSNYPQNDLVTGDVGGSAPDGNWAIFSIPHGKTDDSGLYCELSDEPDLPIECFQNDGLQIESAAGDTLYAFGGRFDTANSGKLTFLLDGVDIHANSTDNIDNWQREGEVADHWQFVGVIDTDGFLTAEVKELRGKDYQQVLLFADDFSIGVTTAPVPGSVFGNVAGIFLSYSFFKDLLDYP